MDNKLLCYSAKDHFFRAAICRMCVEVDDAATNVQKYEDMFPSFSDSRECKLLKVRSCQFVRLLTGHFHVIFSSEIAYTYKSWCVDIFVEFMSNSECLKYSRSLFLKRTPSFKQVMYLFMEVSPLNGRNFVLHLHTCFAKFIQYFLTGAHSGTRGSEFRFLLCGDPSVRQYFSTRPVVHDALVTREEEHGR